MSSSSTPFGWSTGRMNLHYKSVYPTTDRGMQATLHRNLTKRLYPKPHLEDPNVNYVAGSRILKRNRRPSNLPYCYNPSVSAEITDMYGDISPRTRHTPGRRLPSLPRPYTSQDVDDITKRVTTFDPARIAESKGYRLPSPQPLVKRIPKLDKRYTRDQIAGVVTRLSMYDPVKHPAESKGYLSDEECPMQYRYTSSLPTPRGMSASTYKTTQTMPSTTGQAHSERVQQIVERLSAFDTSKWPPESKQRKH